MTDQARYQVYLHYDANSPAVPLVSVSARRAGAAARNAGGYPVLIRCSRDAEEVRGRAVAPRRLGMLLKQQGIGPGFDGAFLIKGVTHTTAAAVRGWETKTKRPVTGPARRPATPPGAWAVPSQVKILLGAPGPRPPRRLTADAPRPARELQKALVAAGYTRASFLIED
jgi:hypothetical protein